MTVPTSMELALRTGAVVQVSPALGNPWTGRIGSPMFTDGGDLRVDCVDPRRAIGLRAGLAYAVLPRFAVPIQSGELPDQGPYGAGSGTKSGTCS